MDLLIIIIAFLFFLIGLIGAILPIIPGPIITYLGILLLYFFSDLNFSNNEIFIYTVATVLVFFSDYILQFFGVRKFGGQKNAIYGTMFGVLIGLFFPPIGLIIGPFLGAFFGALMDNKEKKQAIRVAFGALLGFLFGTFIKILYSIYVIYIVAQKILTLF